MSASHRVAPDYDQAGDGAFMGTEIMKQRVISKVRKIEGHSEGHSLVKAVIEAISPGGTVPDDGGGRRELILSMTGLDNWALDLLCQEAASGNQGEEVAQVLEYIPAGSELDQRELSWEIARRRMAKCQERFTKGFQIDETSEAMEILINEDERARLDFLEKYQLDEENKAFAESDYGKACYLTVAGTYSHMDAAAALQRSTTVMDLSETASMIEAILSTLPRS